MNKIVLLVVAALLASASSVFAAGKAPPAPPETDGKRTIRIEAVEEVAIELPNRELQPFGKDFRARLETHLINSSKYSLFEAAENIGVGEQSHSKRSETARKSSRDPWVWNGTAHPVATLRIQVDAMSFTTGARGERSFYGFDERMNSPFADGTGHLQNEFPLRDEDSAATPNWFDHHFDVKGEGMDSSTTGLDLGEGLSIDILFAWLKLKYARYASDIALTIEIDSPLSGRHEFRKVRVSGKGFFFDISAGYMGYSGGIAVARTDALLRAFRASIDASMEALDRSLQGMPITGKIDGVVRDPQTKEHLILLGTGRDSRVRPGVRFQAVDAPALIFEAVMSVQSGTVARLVQGDLAGVKDGMVVVSEGALVETQALAQQSSSKRRGIASEIELAGTEQIDLPWTNFSKADFKKGDLPKLNKWKAFFESIGGLFTLAHRIWRYRQYDRSYAERPDAVDNGKNPFVLPGEDSPRTAASRSAASSGERPSVLNRFIAEAAQSSWAKKIGWKGEVSVRHTRVPVVAIIDTGVDYNHPALHGNLATTEEAPADELGRRARYGWDFFSGDSRPYDDHYHGTELASLVVAIAPHAKVLPYKVFNPYGITSSGAIEQAFLEAIAAGADVILCGWATRRPSEAIRWSVERARDAGIIVVAAGGDRGKSFESNDYWPAKHALTYDNVLPVFAVDGQDRFATTGPLSSNFSTTARAIAAPGVEMPVANPRGQWATASSTAHAAALVAGAVARIVSKSEKGLRPSAVIDTLLTHANSVSAISTKVRDGKRLRIPD